jgi:hypothetical protein
MSAFSELAAIMKTTWGIFNPFIALEVIYLSGRGTRRGTKSDPYSTNVSHSSLIQQEFKNSFLYSKSVLHRICHERHSICVSVVSSMELFWCGPVVPTPISRLNHINYHWARASISSLPSSNFLTHKNYPSDPPESTLLHPRRFLGSQTSTVVVVQFKKSTNCTPAAKLEPSTMIPGSVSQLAPDVLVALHHQHSKHNSQRAALEGHMLRGNAQHRRF